MAIKKRGQGRAAPSSLDIESFASQADGGQVADQVAQPNERRDYKAIRVPFNRYEYQQLQALADATGRSKLNAIRWAILQQAEAALKEGQD